MRKSSSFAALIFIVILAIGGGLAFAMYRVATRKAYGLESLPLLSPSLFLSQLRLRISGKGW